MDWGPKSPKQWICREWVGKMGSNESDKHKNRFRWQEDVNGQVYNEENHPRQSLRRSFLYISFRFNYKVSSWCYSNFLFFSPSSSLVTSSSFYTSFSFHPCPPRACQMAGVDTCPISIFHKSCVVTVRLITTVQVSPPY